jgi:predicted nucleotidyltransferase
MEPLKPLLEKLPHLVSAYLFGSQANNTQREDSDVDLALLFEWNHAPAGLDAIALRESIADAIGKEVDLVILNDASPILLMQVLKGKELFVNNHSVNASFWMRAFTDYCDLKMMRAPLEKEILKRKFYG